MMSNRELALLSLPIQSSQEKCSPAIAFPSAGRAPRSAAVWPFPLAAPRRRQLRGVVGPNDQVQPPGRPVCRQTAKIRHAGPVGCNGWFDKQLAAPTGALFDPANTL